MNGPLARFVARTCHANAFLRGRPVPEFSPGNFHTRIRRFLVGVRPTPGPVRSDNRWTLSKEDDVLIPGYMFFNLQQNLQQNAGEGYWRMVADSD